MALVMQISYLRKLVQKGMAMMPQRNRILKEHGKGPDSLETSNNDDHRFCEARQIARCAGICLADLKPIPYGSHVLGKVFLECVVCSSFADLQLREIKQGDKKIVFNIRKSAKQLLTL